MSIIARAIKAIKDKKVAVSPRTEAIEVQKTRAHAHRSDMLPMR